MSDADRATTTGCECCGDETARCAPGECCGACRRAHERLNQPENPHRANHSVHEDAPHTAHPDKPCEVCGGSGNRNGSLRAADAFGDCPACDGTGTRGECTCEECDVRADPEGDTTDE